ncbi:hypothetical protein A2Y85_04005 [candidate division WOR-3 bacterium RBG_13_43_14]|uniref:DUF481 domain-containing protein n=1 Tax=candidate division WOR-3 bacterium RBG_13_43_14 TaxID=1802590 RepID=A0A1F4U9V0_UNCW3|nr:MAG: hypothetical protein A2Y85_04005 [candidate division WOR-3 bacterium RBG_13_43_14]
MGKLLGTFKPLLLIAALSATANGIEIPVEFHGSALLGKYLNPDTIRYNMDASIDLYCMLIRQGAFSFYFYYRDDLDMAEQTGGVSLDPRYAHYYVVAGIDYMISRYYGRLSFSHDCVHDIDIDVEGTPNFNRFYLTFANNDYHPTRRRTSQNIVIWKVDLGIYPHWLYHGWDINAGADYQFDILVQSAFTWKLKKNINIEVEPIFHIARGDTCWYHQHVARAGINYRPYKSQIGIRLDYNIWNNDPIKDPDKLWLLSLFVAF